MPELLPGNEQVWECFTLCCSQLRAGFSGAYALDWGVVVRAASDMGIETDRIFYQLLRVFEAVLIGEMTKEKPADG